MEGNQFVDKNGKEFVDSFLIPWLSIQSVSADATKKDECLKACQFLQEEFKRSGMDVEQIDLSSGNPLIYAEKLVNPALPTVLIYGHYDVQPIKEPEKWIVDGTKIEGFTPEVIGDRLYARGATDDKGQVACHALSMRYFAEHGFPCNIKFIIEGDEESGGSTFEEYVKENAEKLKCDCMIISDTETMVSGKPALTTSLRGIAVATITADCTYKIIEMIHNSHDPRTNTCLIPDFYDDVREFEMDEDAEKLAGNAPKDLGPFIRPEEGFTQLYNRWYRPSNSPLFINFAKENPEGDDNAFLVTCNSPLTALHSGKFGGPVIEPGMALCHMVMALDKTGMELGVDFIDYGSRVVSTSIQPSGTMQIYGEFSREEFEGKFAEACMDMGYDVLMFTIEQVDRRAYLKNYDSKSAIPTAYMSFRLVADQDPDKIVESLTAFVENQGCDIEIQHAGGAFLTELDNKYCHAVIEGLKKGYGEDHVHMIAEGGSIPITLTLSETLKIPVILAGFSSPFDNLHAPNESFLIEGSLFNGAKSSIAMLQEIAKLKD